MDVPLGTTRRLSLKESVARDVRDLILAGKLRPGRRIDLSQLTEQMGVSRIPLREALIMLETEGIVENRSRHGSYVAEITPQDIQDHFELYGRVSGLAAEHAASADNPELLQELALLLDAMRKATTSVEQHELNNTFHRTINRAGMSNRLRSVLRPLSNSMPSRYFESDSGSTLRPEALAEHATMVDLLRAGDGPGVSHEMMLHFRETGRKAVQRLQAAGFWDESAGPVG